jgi:hypothetical protein
MFLLGVALRGYAALCTGLRSVADMRGCQSQGLTIWVLCRLDPLWRTPLSLGGPIQCQSHHGLRRVLYVVEPLCQAAMGWLPALECLLPGTSGGQWLRPVLSSV